MCAHCLYTVLHIYIFYIHMYIIYIFKSSRMHRNTTASISSHRPKHPHRGYLPTWGWGCVAGLGGGSPALCSPPPHPPELDPCCSAPRRSQERRIRPAQPAPRRPSPGPQVAGSPRFWGPHGRSPAQPLCPPATFGGCHSPSRFFLSDFTLERWREGGSGGGGGDGRGAGLQWGRGVSSKK